MKKCLRNLCSKDFEFETDVSNISQVVKTPPNLYFPLQEGLLWKSQGS